MQALSKIITFKQQPNQVLKSDNPFAVSDRAARCVMQRTAERIDVAGRLLCMPVLNSSTLRHGSSQVGIGR
jgi:hypothetical protein